MDFNFNLDSLFLVMVWLLTTSYCQIGMVRSAQHILLLQVQFRTSLCCDAAREEEPLAGR